MMNFLFNLAGYSGNAGSAAVSHNKQFERALIKALLKLLVLIAILWLINISGWQVLNLVPFFGITILLIATGFSPLALSATILAGAVTRADQIKGIPSGIPAGAQIWIAQVLPAIVVSCHILIGFLATWSFAANPIAFWYFAMACMTICSAVLAWKKMEGDFLFKLVVGYSAVVAIFALVTTQWPDAVQLLDREGRAQLQQQKVVDKRQAEIAEAEHDAKVKAAAYVPLPVLPESVSIPACGNPDTDWVEVDIPAGWTFVPAWQKEIASFQVLPNDSATWTDNPTNTSSSIGSVRFCTPESYYRGKSMKLTWKQK